MLNNNYRNLSDEDLLHRIAIKQDQEAFGVLYQRYLHLALGVCIKYLKSPDLAKDAVQVIFVRIWTDVHQHQVRKFKPWFYQVVKNHCLMELRKKDPNQKIVADWDMDIMESEETLHHKLNEEHLILTLHLCLKALNNEQKQCIEHFYLNQKSYNETAILTGFSDKKVKTNIQNGRRNLKNCLKQKITNQA
ncbi:sigma-70 family RNA polymerase sigma factor [Taibaiella lutea]|uniref:Sigma-70 family RNA polymerase sigma factor n=1 Tax=Taibaiella lutea TaxID=2608001 RepID=A0A5M6CDQ8_9BACT|nr:sigma-70 family RNA polymerase sigma factor [Taibaiella lutea]KAA5532590.1 sigma-70 family RNA polymerase sigma factor [Taibaiella lutea]